MGCYAAIADLDHLHAMQNNPVIVNHHHRVSDKHALVRENSQTVFEQTNEYSMVPQCRCGALRGAALLGMHCDKPTCDSDVEERFGFTLEHKLWLKAPQGVHAFIHPEIWMMLHRASQVGKPKKGQAKTKVNLLEWMAGIDNGRIGRTQEEYHPMVIDLMNAGVEPGFNNLVANLDRYIAAMIQVVGREGAIKADKIRDVYAVVQKYRHLCTPKHLPLPNALLVVLEHTNNEKYHDKLHDRMRDVLSMMSGIDTPTAPKHQRRRELLAAKAVNELAQYEHEYNKEMIGKKPGLIRKQLLGFRVLFSQRAVIVSKTDRHVYNELSLPWGLSIGQLEIHLTSKLIKRVFTQEEMVRWDLPASELTQAQIKTFLYKHVTKYNELIELLFKELIDEAVDGCLYMLFVRYPSMSRGSLHLLPIRHIKNNPADQTIGMPEILVSTYNADFDGDQMTAMLVLDHYHAELYKPLLTHNNLRDPNNPGKHTPVVTISKPVSLSIARYIVKGDKEVATPTQAERMLALFAN